MGLCQRCKKAQATFHLTNLDSSGAKTEVHLCERCAQEEGHLQVHKAPVSMTELLDTFVTAKPGSAKHAALVCENCGISYVEFRNQGLLGCANDYKVFKEPLKRLLERAHDGATHHTGKAPRSLGVQRRPVQDLQRLRRQLDEAVAAEDYERAAALRDKIKELEQA